MKFRARAFSGEWIYFNLFQVRGRSNLSGEFFVSTGDDDYRATTIEDIVTCKMDTVELVKGGNQ